MFHSAMNLATRISSAVDHQVPDCELSATANYQINSHTYSYNTQYNNTHWQENFSSHFCTLNTDLFCITTQIKHKCILKYF